MAEQASIAGKDWVPPKRDRVPRIRARLREVYGTPVVRPHGDAIAELVLTVLSQSTNDRHRDVASLRRRDRFSSWEAVRHAPAAAVEEAIRPGAGFDELHDAMLALTPRGAEWELHVNLLRHGRRTCAAQRPRCGECALARMCPSRAG